MIWATIVFPKQKALEPHSWPRCARALGSFVASLRAGTRLRHGTPLGSAPRPAPVSRVCVSSAAGILRKPRSVCRVLRAMRDRVWKPRAPPAESSQPPRPRGRRGRPDLFKPRNEHEWLQVRRRRGRACGWRGALWPHWPDGREGNASFSCGDTESCAVTPLPLTVIPA